MTDDRTGDEEVGTVAEETAKLLSALQDWAKDSGHEHASAATHAASGLADSVRGIGDHVGHGPDCKFCPVCQVINVVRETSPEVKQHLAVAANSLLQAMQGLLATQVPDSAQARRSAPVEKIDLDDDIPWDDDSR
ncbi:MAG TPA: hypothetical protein VLI04_21550 [Nocardioidaceae bacterium]|nr:hypothetical protein [Nocardioidaceae bacterium]